MRRQSSQSIELNWLKLALVGLVVVLIGVLIYVTTLYQTIQHDKRDAFDVTRSRVEALDEAYQIQAINRYHGETYLHVVEASREETAVVLFVDPSDEDAAIRVEKRDEWVAVSEIVTLFKETYREQLIRHVNIGLRHNTPLLEIVSHDKNQRFRYDYYRLSDGTYDSGISFKQNF